MKTLDYLIYYASLTAQKKISEIKKIRTKLTELKNEGKNENELATTQALIQWQASNLIVPQLSPPTMDELNLYMEVKNKSEYEKFLEEKFKNKNSNIKLK